MKNGEVATLKAQLDTDYLETDAASIIRALSEVSKMASEVGSQITRALEPVLTTIDTLVSKLESIKMPIEELTTSLRTIAEYDFGEVLTELINISTTLEDISKQLNETDWIGIVSLVMQAFSQGFDIYSYETTRPRGKFEAQSKTLFGTSKGKYAVNGESEQLGLSWGGNQRGSWFYRNRHRCDYKSGKLDRPTYRVGISMG